MSDLATIEVPADIKENVNLCVQLAQSTTIANVEDYGTGADLLKQIKTAQKAADEWFDPLVENAHRMHKMILERKKQQTEPLKTAESMLKMKLLAYDNEQKAKAEAERKRLQAIADAKAAKEREAAELAARKQREIQAENDRIAANLRKQAEEAQAAERKKLLAQAAAAEAKANAASEKAEAKVEQAAAVAAPTIAVAAPDTKVAGISTRRVWKAFIQDRDALLAYLCENKKFEYLEVNLKMLDSFAKAQNVNAKMPGVKFDSVASIASKGA